MLKKYPFVKQEGVKDCGPASLLMIIRYYNGNVPIERLRDLSKINKNGVSAYNLINAANLIGFSAKGVKGNIDDLNNVILPCIAHVIIDDVYKHYIVIYNIDFNRKKLTIADPSKGIKKISFSDFSNIWTGVLVILYPCRTLPISKNINISQFIYKNIIKYKKILILLLFLSFIVILLKLSCSFYFKYIIEGISISKNYLWSIFIIFLLLSFSKLVVDYLRSKFLIILNNYLDFSLTLDTFRHVILLPYNYYHNRTTGEVISKINDIDNIRNFISKICINLFIDFPLVLVSLFFLASINLKLLFLTLIIFALYFILSLIYGKIYDFYIRKIKVDRELVNSYMYDAISGFETVKGINIEDKVIDKFNCKYISFLNNIYLLQNHINNQTFFKNFINDIGNLIILFVGALIVFDGDLSIGYLITYSSMMVYFLDPIRNIIDLDFNIKDAKESILRLLSLYEVNNDKGVINFRNGNIEFRNLSFSFDNNKNILNGINLCIFKGEKIMVYGASGSGKSTLFKLLMRYYEVSRGMIFVDGIDINDYTIKSLRKKISYVSQNELLFNDTLLNNINFYGNNLDVIDMTKVLEFNEIMDNGLGLNMLVEENGFNLSGGQRERIILARALLKRSEIILIDEGLSQVDSLLERKILTNIFNKYADKTIIIISHRMENLDLYDRLVCLNDGVILKDEKA